MNDLTKNLWRAIDLAEEHCGAAFGEARDDLAALAAALEAAREDGERLEWLESEAEGGIRLHSGDFNGRHVGLGLMAGSTRRTLRAAIDQARGKGVE